MDADHVSSRLKNFKDRHYRVVETRCDPENGPSSNDLDGEYCGPDWVWDSTFSGFNWFYDRNYNLIEKSFWEYNHMYFLWLEGNESFDYLFKGCERVTLV